MNDMRYVVLKILRKDRELSHHAEVRTGGRSHEESAEI